MKFGRVAALALALAGGAGFFTLAMAQDGAPAGYAGPTPATPTPPIAAPRDVPYPGTIKLSVDATGLSHGIFRVREAVPVSGPGPMTLLYPQWLPGNHSPSGPIDKFAGLIIHANGQRIEWKRDPVHVYGFHVDVPAGVSTLDVDFQYLSPVAGNEGRIVMTPDMLNVEWNAVVLYPAGYYSRRIMVTPSVTLPDGWKYGTALRGAKTNDGAITFNTVPLNTLVDSPMFAGRYFERFDLDPHGPAPVYLDVVADRPDELVVKPEQLAAHRAIVQQAYKLYGSHHYDHYDFLLGLSDKMGGTGLEHHQSSEDATRPKYFMDWDQMAASRDLLTHEYTHSWNGKFRRPADLWTPNYNVPMRDSLLWVYEGQTQYWGYVLAARAGLWTHQQALDTLAVVAATYDQHRGRAWKSLEDTTNDPIVARRRPIPWRTWQRSEDYYSEGQLVWLDADTLIRKLSGGKRSLDDFARTFFGIDNGSYVTVTYTFDDIVKALNAVQPYDWAKFLHTRLEEHAKGAPLDGITRGGYRLVYSDVESGFEKSAEHVRHSADLAFSLGLTIGKEGQLTDVVWNSPAFKAGINVGDKIVAVNGDTYDNDRLKEAVTWAKPTRRPSSYWWRTTSSTTRRASIITTACSIRIFSRWIRPAAWTRFSRPAVEGHMSRQDAAVRRCRGVFLWGFARGLEMPGWRERR